MEAPKSIPIIIKDTDLCIKDTDVRGKDSDLVVKDTRLGGKATRLFSMFCILFSVLAGCAHFFGDKTTPAYSKSEIEAVRIDTILGTDISRVLPALKKALLEIGFEIESELSNSIVTFQMEVEEADFGEYAVQEVSNGYEPISENELYEAPFVKLQCSITSVGRKTRLVVTTLFEAYRKEIVYRQKSATPPDLITKGYQEFKGEEIRCTTTGEFERRVFSHIPEILLKQRRKRLLH